MRKTHNQFIAEIKDRPFICLEKYQTDRTKIQFQCCICGHEWAARPNDLLQGHGCPECALKALKGENHILEDRGTWVLLDISTTTHPEATMKIDKQDLPLLTGRVCIANGYPAMRDGRKSVRVHKKICSFDITDHISGDTTDNRRVNLRLCSSFENMQNRKIHENNTSGMIGVAFFKGQWIARIQVNKRRILLGRFKTKEEAIKARLGAEADMYGKFARDKGCVV